MQGFTLTNRIIQAKIGVRAEVGFFKTYAEEPLRSKLDAVPGDLRVSYLDYDWSLNGT